MKKLSCTVAKNEFKKLKYNKFEVYMSVPGTPSDAR